MGKSKEQYIEIMTIEIERERYYDLVESGCIKPADVTIVSVKPKEYDYADSDLWHKAKHAANKAYSKLKQIEFDLRHGNIKDGN